jgi:hypothetical protein
MTAVPVAWLVARSAGLVAFGLLTLSVWLGLAMSTRLLGPKRQKPLLALHRTLAWTGLSMVGVHVGAILRPRPPLRCTRGARPRRSGMAACPSCLRRRGRLADSRPRRLVQREALDRAEGVETAALRILRRLLAGHPACATHGHRPQRLRRTGHCDPRSGSRPLADVLPAPGPAPCAGASSHCSPALGYVDESAKPGQTAEAPD